MNSLSTQAAKVATLTMCIGVVAVISSAAVTSDDRTRAIEMCTHGTNDQQKCTTEIDEYRSFSGLSYDVITDIEKALNEGQSVSSRNGLRKIGALYYWAQSECAKWGTNHYNIKCNIH